MYSAYGLVPVSVTSALTKNINDRENKISSKSPQDNNKCSSLFRPPPRAQVRRDDRVLLVCKKFRYGHRLNLTDSDAANDISKYVLSESRSIPARRSQIRSQKDRLVLCRKYKCTSP